MQVDLYECVGLHVDKRVTGYLLFAVYGVTTCTVHMATCTVHVITLVLHILVGINSFYTVFGGVMPAINPCYQLYLSTAADVTLWFGYASLQSHTNHDLLD